jgi:hypothetical protein
VHASRVHGARRCRSGPGAAGGDGVRARSGRADGGRAAAAVPGGGRPLPDEGAGGIYALAIVSGKGDDSDRAINLDGGAPFNLMMGNRMDVPVDWAGEQDFNA